MTNRSAPPSAFKSKVEEAILKSTEPITINETKEITANKERGLWANRCEVCTWKGDLPIQEYPINEDNCPELIKKKSCKRVEYNQEIAIRYLKPPSPAAPGDIIITLIENEHPVFQRENDNLLMIKNINLYELYDITFDLKHLDDTILRITKNANDSLHLNDSLRKIPGEGMPIYKSDKRGDLFIRFNLVIPKTLDSSKLKVFKEIFQTETPELSTDGASKNCILENISETDLEELDYSSSDSESDSGSESDSDSVSSLDSDSEQPKNKFSKRR
jgi:DnaJ-class molecular chaperone